MSLRIILSKSIDIFWLGDFEKASSVIDSLYRRSFIGGTSATLLFSETFVFPRSTFIQLLHFFVLGGTFTLLFLSYAWMLGVHEAFEFLGLKKTISEDNSI